MSPLIISNLLGAVTCAIGAGGMRLSGKGRRSGWAIALGGEVLWVAYAVLLQQWLIIPWCLIWGWTYYRNWRAWAPGRKPTLPWEEPAPSA